MGSPPRGRGWRASVRECPALEGFWVAGDSWVFEGSVGIVEVYVGELRDWRTEQIFRAYPRIEHCSVQFESATRKDGTKTENHSFFGV